MPNHWFPDTGIAPLSDTCSFSSFSPSSTRRRRLANVMGRGAIPVSAVTTSLSPCWSANSTLTVARATPGTPRTRDRPKSTRVTSVLVARVDAKRLPHGAFEVARRLRVGGRRQEDDLDLRDAGAPERIRRNLGARDEWQDDEGRDEAGPRRPRGGSAHGRATRASGARALRRRTREWSARSPTIRPAKRATGTHSPRPAANRRGP